MCSELGESPPHRAGFVEVRGVGEREDCGGEHFRFYFLPGETLAGASLRF